MILTGHLHSLFIGFQGWGSKGGNWEPAPSTDLRSETSKIFFAALLLRLQVHGTHKIGYENLEAKSFNAKSEHCPSLFVGRWSHVYHISTLRISEVQVSFCKYPSKPQMGLLWLEPSKRYSCQLTCRGLKSLTSVWSRKPTKRPSAFVLYRVHLFATGSLVCNCNLLASCNIGNKKMNGTKLQKGNV